MIVLNENESVLLTPFKMYAEFGNGKSFYLLGDSESDCMYKISELAEKNKGVTYYTGVCDEDYVDGEYVGRENFIL